MKFFEGVVVFIETDSYYGPPFTTDGVSLRRSSFAHTRYLVNGIEVSADDAMDAIMRQGRDL